MVTLKSILFGRGLDNGNRVPVTATKTSLSLSLHATVGRRRGVIGAVSELSPRQRLEVEEVYEVNSLARGTPVELIPQALVGRSIGLKRYDLYRSTLEEVFGAPELIALTDQTGPISLRIQYRDPNPSEVGAIVDPATFTSTLSVWEFQGCYITDLGRNISAGGNVIIQADATLMWRRVVRLQ